MITEKQLLTIVRNRTIIAYGTISYYVKLYYKIIQYEIAAKKIFEQEKVRWAKLSGKRKRTAVFPKS